MGAGCWAIVAVVSREGIEPSTRGLKVPCSATELPARHHYKVYHEPRPSVQEVASPGEDHRRPALVRSPYDLLIPFGAARLYDGRDAGFGKRLHAVGEGEEGVARR